jgi:hypothetical protein
MLQRITQSAADVVDLLSIEGKILLRSLSRSAGLVALLFVTSFAAAVAALGLVAAAVVALAPHIGTAGALALMSGVVLLACVLTGVTVWSLMMGIRKQEKLDEAERKLAAERTAAMDRLRNPEPEPKPPSPLSFLANIDFGKIDPGLTVAAVGAAAAVVGPVKLIKFAAGLAGNVALISSLISAGKAAAGGASTAPAAPTPNGRSARP